MSVPALWSEVNRYGQNSDFTRALKTVNKSKCPAGPGCPEDAACVRRAASRQSAEGTAASSRSASQLPAASARLLRATCTSLSTRGTRRQGEGEFKETAASAAASKLFLISSPLPGFGKMSD